MSMEHLDRMALVIRPKQPYVDWANSFDDDGPEYDPSARSASVFLNNEVVNVTDIGRVVRKCWRAIFEERLHAWMRDPGVWPRRRSRDMFLEWFDVQICEMVFDMGRGAIHYD